MQKRSNRRLTFRLLDSERERVIEFSNRTYLTFRDSLKLLIAFGIRQNKVPMESIRLPTVRSSREESHIVNIFITDNQWEILDEFRFKNRYRSEVEAIRHAIAAGLEVQKELGVL